MRYQQGRHLVRHFSQRYGLGRFDWFWLLTTPLVAITVMLLVRAHMQAVDYLLFIGFTVVTVWSGCRCLALRYCYLAVLVLSAASILLYAGGFAAAGDKIILNLGLSSHAAVWWMVGLSFLSFLSATMPRLARPALAGSLSWAAVAMGLLGFFVRWHESYLVGGEAALVPLGNLYDVLVALVLLMLLAHLYLKKSYPHGVRHTAALFTVVFMGSLLLFLSQRYALYFIEHRPAELGHALLKIHVPAMVMAYALLLLAGTLAVAFLTQHYGRVLVPVDAHTGSRSGGKEAQVLLSHLLALGFVLLSLGLISGVIWSELAWGEGWLWEMKQTTAFAVWCYYAAGLHVSLRRHDSRVITAWWLVFGILLLAFALFWSNMLAPGHHYFGQLP